MAEPVLVGLIFADKIITENNGKKGIIGTFTQFHARSFPAAFAPWSIYAAATNLKGTHSFKVLMIHEDTSSEIFNISGNFSIKEFNDVIELDIPIFNSVFPSSGAYSLTFYIDEYQIGARVLHLNLIEASQN